MYRLFLLKLLLLLSFLGFAQDQTLDSLIERLNIEKIDTNKYHLCIRIAKAYSDSAYDKSLIYFNQALDVADKSSDRKKLAHIYHQIGFMYQKKGEFQLALKNYKDALTIHEYLNNKKGVGQILNDIGLIYKTWGKYDKAIENYIGALRLFNEMGDIVNGAMVSNNLGQIYYYRSEYEKAIEYFKEYLEVNKKVNSQRAVAGAANNIASAFMELNKLDDALDYYLISMRIYDSLNIKLGVAIIKDNIGSLFLRRNHYNDALLYHTEALKIFEDLGSKSRICATLQNIGIAYSKLNKHEAAIDYLNKSLDQAIELNQKETQKDVYEVLSNVYERSKQFEKAYTYQKLFVQIKDSLLNAETINKIETIQAEFEAQKRERELSEIGKKLKNQKIILPLFAGIILLFIFLFVLILRENSQKKKLINFSIQNNELLKVSLSRIGKLYTSSINQKGSLDSGFSNYWFVSTRRESTDSSPYIFIQRDSTFYFAFISTFNSSVCAEIVNLSIIDFFENAITLNNNKSLYEHYLFYISNQSNWSKVIGPTNSFSVIFFEFNKSIISYKLSGTGDAFCIQDGVLKKLTTEILSEWIRALSEDQYYFIISQNNSESIIEKEEIFLSINETLQGSVNHSFVSQRDILSSSLDFHKTRIENMSDFSIFALKI